MSEIMQSMISSPDVLTMQGVYEMFIYFGLLEMLGHLFNFSRLGELRR